MFNLIFTFSLLICAGNSFGSAIVTRDQKNKTLTFQSHLYLYGQVTPELTKKIEAEINRVWNQNIPLAQVGTKSYSLKFLVTTSMLSEKEVRVKADTKQTGKDNFVRVLDKPNDAISSSFMVGSSNSGVWLKSQRLGESTTAAHEYGHSLGLSHPDNESFQGPPRLMITDFYAVDPQYMINGKLDLLTRRVTELDIKELHLEKLVFDASETTSIGSFKTVFLFDGSGNITN